MISTKKILEDIEKKVSAKFNIKAAASYPTIRFEDGTNKIAMFISEQDEDGTLSKPILMFLIEVETGKALKGVKCADEPFYEDNGLDWYPGVKSVSDESDSLIEMYTVFDSIRQAISENADSQYVLELYADYMNRLNDRIPEECRPLYNALSMPRFSTGEESKRKTVEKRHAEEKDSISNTPENTQLIANDDTEKEEAEVGAEYSLKNINWSPISSLSKLPERTYRLISRIAPYIEILKTDTPDKIKYSYPIYCEWSDVTKGADKWVDLLNRLRSGTVPMGHYKIRPGKNLYSTCKKGTVSCVFGKCPYVVAAYINYLKETNPNKLEKEREEYHKNRFSIDAQHSETLPYSLIVPKNLNSEKLMRGLEDTDDYYVACVPVNSGLFSITWYDGDDKKSAVISQQEFMSGRLPFRDVSSHDIPERVCYALVADYLDRSGKYEEVLKSVWEDLTPFLDEKSIADKCILSKYTRAYYGTIYSDSRPEDSEALKILIKSLSSKGISSHAVLSARDFSGIKPESNVLYVINDFLEINNILTFKNDTYVTLFGKKEVIKSLPGAISIRRLFGLCSLCDKKEADIDTEVSKLEADLNRILPEQIKNAKPSSFGKQLRDWYQENRDTLPVKGEDLATFLAWQFCIDNPFRLRDYAGRGKKEGSKNA